MGLGLRDSPRKLVFRKLVSILQNDPALKRVVRPTSWYCWDGMPAGNLAFGSGNLPAIRVTPLGTQAAPATSTRQECPLPILIEVATPGLDVGDLLDFWTAVEDAIFTGDGAKAALTALRIANANVIDLHLGQPGITPSAEGLANGAMYGSGTLTVNMMVKK